jgi:hypothetical protein
VKKSDKIYSRNTLLAKLHISKSQLKLTDEEYRAILSGWKHWYSGKPIESSKDLTDDQIIEVLDCMTNKLGWKPQPRKKQRKFIKTVVPGQRPKEFASQFQLEKINVLWVKHSKVKDKESLQKFVKRILHVDLLESIQEEDVHILIKAIESL